MACMAIAESFRNLEPIVEYFEGMVKDIREEFHLDGAVPGPQGVQSTVLRESLTMLKTSIINL